MNVLEDQIRERMENEEVMLREAFSDAASVIREENKKLLTNSFGVNIILFVADERMCV